MKEEAVAALSAAARFEPSPERRPVVAGLAGVLLGEADRVCARMEAEPAQCFDLVHPAGGDGGER